MKRRFIKFASVMAMSALLFTACQEEGVAPDENSITAAIEKIETSYMEGDVKIEGIYVGEKHVTRSSDSYIRILAERIKNEIKSAKKRKVLQKKLLPPCPQIYGDDCGGYGEGPGGGYTPPKYTKTAYDIGIIPNIKCPSWSEKITIQMDCEDTNPKTVIKCDGGSCSGLTYEFTWRGLWHTNLSYGNLHMVYCRVDGRKFKSFHPSGKRGGGNYAVLKLGSLTPPEAETTVLMRYFDNEDSSNGNWTNGDIGPNVVNNNTLLQFHVFLEKTSSSLSERWPSLGFGYGVFGSPAPAYGYLRRFYGIVHVDDEDNKNTNYWSPEIKTNPNAAIDYRDFEFDGTGDTDMRIQLIRLE